MSEITDWEPEMITHEKINWEERYERLFNINEKLSLENQSLKNQKLKAESDWEPLVKTNKFIRSQNAELSDKLARLKAEAIATLKAIDMCILATLNTEKQHLTHRARNFRMRHVHQIICNQIDGFCDRKLTNYEDDF
jgi:hypothetical protein